MNEIRDFKIFVNSPQHSASFDSEDAKLSDAIYTIYPLETEDAVLL